jgi:hypothetical protein
MREEPVELKYNLAQKISAILPILFFWGLLWCPVIGLAQEYSFEGDQNQAERSIEQYFKNEHAEKYNSISFGKLTTHLPAEYIELQGLIALKDELPGLRENYAGRLDSVIADTDARIDSLKRQIMARRIRPSYEILHYYAVKEGKSYRVYGYVIYMNHAYRVMRMRTWLEAFPEKIEYEWFSYWQNRGMLFNMHNPKKNTEASNEIYDHLELGMELSENRKEYFHNGLTLVRTVTQSGVFDIHQVCQAIARDHHKRSGLEDALAISSFSDAFELSINGMLSGYKVYGATKDARAPYIIFTLNKYFELLEMTPTNDDHSNSFKK